MPSLRYLNSVLTIIAVLLTLNVYALWTAAPAGSALAPAETYAAENQGIPNAGQQRLEMINQLKQANAELSVLHRTLTSGQVRVQVEGNESSD